MFKSKKFIITAVLGIAIIGGSIGGAVLADDGDDTAAGNGTRQGPQFGGNLERVCEIYQENTGDTIDCDELGIAFRAALEERATEMRANMEEKRAAMSENREDRLQNLVDEGIITQEQLDELEAWMEARPEAGADQAEIEAWLEARPDIEMPMGLGGPAGRGGDMPNGNFGGKHSGGFPRFGGQEATIDA